MTMLRLLVVVSFLAAASFASASIAEECGADFDVDAFNASALGDDASLVCSGDNVTACGALVAEHIGSNVVAFEFACGMHAFMMEMMEMLAMMGDMTEVCGADFDPSNMNDTATMLVSMCEDGEVNACGQFLAGMSDGDDPPITAAMCVMLDTCPLSLLLDAADDPEAVGRDFCDGNALSACGLSVAAAGMDEALTRMGDTFCFLLQCNDTSPGFMQMDGPPNCTICDEDDAAEFDTCAEFVDGCLSDCDECVTAAVLIGNVSDACSGSVAVDYVDDMYAGTDEEIDEASETATGSIAVPAASLLVAAFAVWRL